VDLENPDHELRVVFSDAAGDVDDDTPGRICAVGWAVAASVRDFGQRMPSDRPFFQPGSMAPMDARALANLAGARPARRFWTRCAAPAASPSRPACWAPG